MNDAFCRPAILSDIVYIDALQRKNAENLAFYPVSVFEREIAASRVLLCGIYSDPCGYLWHGALGKKAAIHQACIQYDVRGMLYGAHMVGSFIAICRSANVMDIGLRCGSDIEANHFWRRLGFLCIGVTKGGARRMRDINHWHLSLQPRMFDVAIQASDKKKTSAAWNKRNTGIVASRFSRRKIMLNYRGILEPPNDTTP